MYLSRPISTNGVGGWVGGWGTHTFAEVPDRFIRRPAPAIQHNYGFPKSREIGCIYVGMFFIVI
jgi:hypothetical protein